MASDWSLNQPRAWRVFESWIFADRLPHAILLCGPSGTGKRKLAIKIASVLLCQDEFVFSCKTCSSCKKIDSLSHSDLRILLPSLVADGNRSIVNTSGYEYVKAYLNGQLFEHSGISIEQVRELQNEMVYTPRENNRKVAILFESELMHQAAANSLLKMLEEPSKNCFFILVTAYPERLLPTVLSRCQRLALNPFNKADLRDELLKMDVDADSRELSVRLSQGSLVKAQEILKGDLDEIRKAVENFIESGILHRDGFFWEIVEKIGKKKGKNHQINFLELCAFYLRDFFLIRNEKIDLITMVDRKDYLNSLVSYWKNEQIDNGVQILDQAIESLQRNVSFDLVIVDFWRHLRHLGSKKRFI